MKVQWNNLVEDRCPECSYSLNHISFFYRCSKCPFKIHQNKYLQLVSRFVEYRNRRLYNSHQDPEANLAMLNSL